MSGTPASAVGARNRGWVAAAPQPLLAHPTTRRAARWRPAHGAVEDAAHEQLLRLGRPGLRHQPCCTPVTGLGGAARSPTLTVMPMPIVVSRDATGWRRGRATQKSSREEADGRRLGDARGAEAEPLDRS